MLHPWFCTSLRDTACWRGQWTNASRKCTFSLSGASDSVKMFNVEVLHLHPVYLYLWPHPTRLSIFKHTLSVLLFFFSSFVHRDLSSISFVSVAQVLAVSGSVPLKVSAALCAAQDAAYSLQDLLERERMISNVLKQVKSWHWFNEQQLLLILNLPYAYYIQFGPAAAIKYFVVTLSIL